MPVLVGSKRDESFGAKESAFFAGRDEMASATHTSEMQYVFNNPRNTPWTDVDHQASDTMSAYWINFAANGDPTPPEADETNRK